MPVSNGTFRPLTEDEIYQRFKDAFEQQFDSTVEPGDLIEKHLQAEAAVLAQNQERAMREVYQSAYIQDASGDELNKLVARIGLSRRLARGSSGVAEFFRNSIPTSTYTIPNGTVVQTGGSDPIEFETQEAVQLEHIDGFEDGDVAEWSGDTASFAAVTHSSAVGTYALEVPATSGVSIYRGDRTPGKTYNFNIYPNAGAVKAFRFGRQDGSNYYEAEVDQNAGEITISIFEGGATQSSSTQSVTIPSGEITHVEVEHGIEGTLSASLYDTQSRDTELASVSETDSEQRFYGGGIEFASKDGTATAYVDEVATTHTAANVEAIDLGVDTNIAVDTIRQMPSPPAGVDGVTNPLPTGDPQYTDTNDSEFIIGRDEETDEALRDRAFEQSTIGGAATVSAIESALRNIEHVESLTMYQNKTQNDNTGSGGLPPYSFEPVIYYTGTDEEIAKTIFDTKAIDSRDYGGAHGTERTYTVSSGVLNADETIHWSEVPELTIDVELTLIVDDSYVGDDAIRSRVVNYVGGIDVDGADITGLDVGEDVYVAVLKDSITGPDDTGVWEVDSISLDSTNDGIDDTTTLGNGAEVLAVADNEVARTNGRDGSITITTVAK